MREFTKVAPSLWRSARFKALGDDARFIYLYLLTSEHQNSAGAFRLPTGYALADLNWEAGRYAAAMRALVEADLIVWDQATEEMRICRWFKHNPPMNPNHSKGIATILAKLESDDIREKASAEFQEAQLAKAGAPEKQSNGSFAGYNGDLTGTEFMQGKR